MNFDLETLIEIKKSAGVATSVGTLIFSSYVGLCPASTVYPPKIWEYQEIFEIFATPKTILILYIYLKKRPRNT